MASLDNISPKKSPSQGGVRGGTVYQSARLLGTDPYCGGKVYHAKKNVSATCLRCGLLSSPEWWKEKGLRGLA